MPAKSGVNDVIAGSCEFTTKTIRELLGRTIYDWREMLAYGL